MQAIKNEIQESAVDNSMQSQRSTLAHEFNLLYHSFSFHKNMFPTPTSYLCNKDLRRFIISHHK